MKTAHKTELTLIGLATIATVALQDRLPKRMEAGYFILVLAMLFLVQSLVRDLWLLSRKRDQTKPKHVARCMCLETGVGVLPIVFSAILMFGGFSRPFNIPAWAWMFGVPATMLINFWIKDYVFEWNPWRIRRDEDHINMIFKWRG